MAIIEAAALAEALKILGGLTTVVINGTQAIEEIRRLMEKGGFTIEDVHAARDGRVASFERTEELINGT